MVIIVEYLHQTGLHEFIGCRSAYFIEIPDSKYLKLGKRKHDSCWPGKFGFWFFILPWYISLNWWTTGTASKIKEKATLTCRNKAKPQYAPSQLVCIAVGLNVDLQQLNIWASIYFLWNTAVLWKASKDTETQHCRKDPCTSLMLIHLILNVKSNFLKCLIRFYGQKAIVGFIFHSTEMLTYAYLCCGSSACAALST